MQEKVSVKGNIIRYDRSTLEKDIEEILASRFEGKDYFEKGLHDLHDPYLLCGMKEAVSRIKEAIDKKQKIIIFGDYDVDGVTSTSILMHFFKKIGALSSYRLPHRIKDGYGMKSYFMDELAELGVDLVITVDCGTRDVEVVKYAKSKGIDVIITDHHFVPDIIPEEAVAIINPKRQDCNYPFKNLAGAGVAFKLMQALASDYFDEKAYEDYLHESIDIAAIGTVADCMSLTGENRTIVELGLKQLKNSRSKGIRTLIEDKIHEDLDADIFGFVIGPRLNAAGRMDSPYKAVNLILNNGDSLGQTLGEIENLNEKRKTLTKKFCEDALGKVNRDDNLIFYVSDEIEHGIIGIVAGRLTEQLYKPSIVLIDDGDKLIASCRAPEYFDIVALLEKYSDMFVAFGGHKGAAGFTIEKSKFEEFRKKALSNVNKLDFTVHKKEIKIDKVVRLDELGFNFLDKINKFKPFGMGNTKPLFMVEKLSYEKLDFIGQGRDHLRFTTKHGFKIFGFYMGDHYEQIKRGGQVSLVFDLSLDTWMGKKNLMLKIIDMIVE
ncbi:MAG: single-stranded-DNA-specific exonuclease RecJ [Candidatus Gracilibacteria bacterium]|nr:single-stranded-DNA-specific exonuclease RecJ [Candidatus Gracilibacteria bacterium]